MEVFLAFLAPFRKIDDGYKYFAGGYDDLSSEIGGSRHSLTSSRWKVLLFLHTLPVSLFLLGRQCTVYSRLWQCKTVDTYNQQMEWNLLSRSPKARRWRVCTKEKYFSGTKCIGHQQKISQWISWYQKRETRRRSVISNNLFPFTIWFRRLFIFRV